MSRTHRTSCTASHAERGGIITSADVCFNDLEVHGRVGGLEPPPDGPAEARGRTASGADMKARMRGARRLKPADARALRTTQWRRRLPVHVSACGTRVVSSRRFFSTSAVRGRFESFGARENGVLLRVVVRAPLLPLLRKLERVAPRRTAPARVCDRGCTASEGTPVLGPRARTPLRTTRRRPRTGSGVHSRRLFRRRAAPPSPPRRRTSRHTPPRRRFPPYLPVRHSLSR